MLWRKREKGKEPLATEILYDLSRKISMYRLALGISLIANAILAAVLILRQ